MNKTKEYDIKAFSFVFGEGSLELAIEQGFDKEELLKSLNIHICKINPT
jgi:hypothetical protein